MIRSTRGTYPVYQGDYIGGGRFAGMGSIATRFDAQTVKLAANLPPPDQMIPTAQTILPVNGGAGPALLSAPQPGELGPQVMMQTMAAPKDQRVPSINPNETEPLRIAIQAEQAVAEDEGTRDMIVLALLGIGGAMGIYALVRALQGRR